MAQYGWERAGCHTALDDPHQTCRRTDPERRVGSGADHAIDGARRQSVSDAIPAPPAVSESVQALRRGEPHRAIPGLGDGADDIRGQPAFSRIRAEASAVRSTDARARAERAGPYRSVRAPVQRGDAARCE